MYSLPPLLVHSLDNNGRGPTTTIANGCTSYGCILVLQYIVQRTNDTSSTHSNGVTQCNSSTQEIHFVVIQAHKSHVGQSDNTKRFIDFMVFYIGMYLWSLSLEVHHLMCLLWLCLLVLISCINSLVRDTMILTMETLTSCNEPTISQMMLQMHEKNGLVNRQVYVSHVL